MTFAIFDGRFLTGNIQIKNQESKIKNAFGLAGLPK